MAATLEDVMKAMCEAHYGPGNGEPLAYKDEAISFLAAWAAVTGAAPVEAPSPAKAKKVKSIAVDTESADEVVP